MARDGIDVLFLGREANARTVSDAARLWLAGTRAFAPGCVVVRHTGAVHLLSNTDAVVPRGLSRRASLRHHLESRNDSSPRSPRSTACATRSRARVDGMSPMASALLARVVPAAEIVDAGPLFAELWGIPDPEKLAGVAAAAAVAERARTRWSHALRPGVRPRDLRGVCAAASSRPRA